MRLSEAIRLGAMVRPQAYGDSGVDAGSCALRAASEAVGMRQAGRVMYSALSNRWPFLHGTKHDCPITTCSFLGAGDHPMMVIFHLNDQHKWTRERIADWVATVESAETTVVESSTSDVRGTTETAQPVLSIREV